MNDMANGRTSSSSDVISKVFPPFRKEYLNNQTYSQELSKRLGNLLKLEPPPPSQNPQDLIYKIGNINQNLKNLSSFSPNSLPLKKEEHYIIKNQNLSQGELYYLLGLYNTTLHQMWKPVLPEAGGKTYLPIIRAGSEGKQRTLEITYRLVNYDAYPPQPFPPKGLPEEYIPFFIMGEMAFSTHNMLGLILGESQKYTNQKNINWRKSMKIWENPLRSARPNKLDSIIEKENEEVMKNINGALAAYKEIVTTQRQLFDVERKLRTAKGKDREALLKKRRELIEEWTKHTLEFMDSATSAYKKMKETGVNVVNMGKALFTYATYVFMISGIASFGSGVAAMGFRGAGRVLLEQGLKNMFGKGMLWDVFLGSTLGPISYSAELLLNNTTEFARGLRYIEYIVDYQAEHNKDPMWKELKKVVDNLRKKYGMKYNWETAAIRSGEGVLVFMLFGFVTRGLGPISGVVRELAASRAAMEELEEKGMMDPLLKSLYEKGIIKDPSKEALEKAIQENKVVIWQETGGEKPMYAVRTKGADGGILYHYYENKLITHSEWLAKVAENSSFGQLAKKFVEDKDLRKIWRSAQRHIQEFTEEYGAEGKNKAVVDLLQKGEASEGDANIKSLVDTFIKKGETKSKVYVGLSDASFVWFSNNTSTVINGELFRTIGDLYIDTYYKSAVEVVEELKGEFGANIKLAKVGGDELMIVTDNKSVLPLFKERLERRFMKKWLNIRRVLVQKYGENSPLVKAFDEVGRRFGVDLAETDATLTRNEDGTVTLKTKNKKGKEETVYNAASGKEVEEKYKGHPILKWAINKIKKRIRKYYKDNKIEGYLKKIKEPPEDVPTQSVSLRFSSERKVEKVAMQKASVMSDKNVFDFVLNFFGPSGSNTVFGHVTWDELRGIWLGLFEKEAESMGYEVYIARDGPGGLRIALKKEGKWLSGKDLDAAIEHIGGVVNEKIEKGLGFAPTLLPGENADMSAIELLKKFGFDEKTTGWLIENSTRLNNIINDIRTMSKEEFYKKYNIPSQLRKPLGKTIDYVKGHKHIRNFWQLAVQLEKESRKQGLPKSIVVKMVMPLIQLAIANKTTETSPGARLVGGW